LSERAVPSEKNGVNLVEIGH